ncbi:hypothetical protein [Maledivibacter halophilus]|uniref:CHAT domain-containing protein n=1 Tax=Maledivibacter halophilus TaxID=36842 RepID=A0A1T5M1C7_9FIRM|nr:hypothetical protein [Maledivibacter halophilus]SKC81923.1 hypothetical protein SAMN02194393_03677 [Maledivibacter halophilus]
MREKFLNISFYLGFIPFYWLYNIIRHRDYRRGYHYLQAIALNLFFFYSFIVFVICFIIHNLIMYYNCSLTSVIPLELSFYILGILVFICFIIWLEGIIAAIIGYMPKIPLYLCIISKTTRINYSIYLIIIRHILVILMIILIIHSASITQSKAEEAEIFMLYDDMGYIPREVFTFGFYRESLVAINRWGENSVAIVPLNKNTLNYALSNGRFVYIASHGANGYIVLHGGDLFWPYDLEGTHISSTLQYVYLSGCDTGLLHDEWESALMPAYVKTFDRLSATIEHIYWLIVEGPKVINSLK